jgi:large subunit ribosomal protein L16
MEGVSPELAQEAMRLASNKLPLRVKFVQRPGVERVASAEKKPAA